MVFGLTGTVTLVILEYDVDPEELDIVGEAVAGQVLRVPVGR